MEKFGLVGYPLGHSFSKKYFTDKFQKLGLKDHSYELFEMESIDQFPSVWERPDLIGVNVTVPHKENVFPFLANLDESAQKVGAVNVIKRENGSLKGYNTDYLAFKETLENWLPDSKPSALILGTGGSSKAVRAALSELKIDYQLISRSKETGDYTYSDLHDHPEVLKAHALIINTTPLGTFPKTEGKADLPYDHLTSEHFLYDLVYNPEVSAFLGEGQSRGAQIKNGLEMLQLQAEKSWLIWNKK